MGEEWEIAGKKKKKIEKMKEEPKVVNIPIKEEPKNTSDVNKSIGMDKGISEKEIKLVDEDKKRTKSREGEDRKNNNVIVFQRNYNRNSKQIKFNIYNQVSYKKNKIKIKNEFNLNDVVEH